MNPARAGRQQRQHAPYRRGSPGFSFTDNEHRRQQIAVASRDALLSAPPDLPAPMTYQVLARKYRPQRFEEVVGQDHVTRTLINAIGTGRIAHAYLFCGPRGTGKTTLARIFAKCLNATNGPIAAPAEDDERCREITEGRSLDVLEIDGASNNGVDQVRELRDTCRFAPAASRFKIYIIDEVHMLSTAAFNALLKTLEEPPAHVKFIFATTDPEKVLPTILSRCQRFDLRRIPASLIVGHLALIAKQENVSVDASALHAIARGADGGMRDAESTLDQLISFCGGQVREEDVLSMFGLASQSQVLELAEAVLRGNAEGALRELHSLVSGGKELGRLVADLLTHFRNLLVFEVTKGDLSLMEISEAETAALASHAKLGDTAAVTRILEALTECELRLRDAMSKKTLVEVSLMKAIEAAKAVSLDTVLQRLQQLRGTPASPALGTPAVGAPVMNAPAVSASAASTPAVSIAPSAAAGTAQQWWPQLVAAAGVLQPFAKSFLQDAHPVAWDTKLLTIGYPKEFADSMELADNPQFHQTLRKALAQIGHADAQAKLVVAERPAGWTAPAELPPATPLPVPIVPRATVASMEASAAKANPAKAGVEDFKNDPLIRQALEVFKGQIVDVRTSG